VIDLSSRRVAGWALADHMRTSLVEDAVAMAFAQRRPAAGVIFHSDRGAPGPDADVYTLGPGCGSGYRAVQMPRPRLWLTVRTRQIVYPAHA
jgi:hypothetical protein